MCIRDSMLRGWMKPPSSDYLYTEDQLISAVNQAVVQGLISQNLANTVIEEVKKGNGQEAASLAFPQTFPTTE